MSSQVIELYEDHRVAFFRVDNFLFKEDKLTNKIYRLDLKEGKRVWILHTK